eukprot:3343401-Prymnesium_polylepis.1
MRARTVRSSGCAATSSRLPVASQMASACTLRSSPRRSLSRTDQHASARSGDWPTSGSSSALTPQLKPQSMPPHGRMASLAWSSLTASCSPSAARAVSASPIKVG